MNQEIKVTLDALIGKTYHKDNKKFTVKSYKQVNSLIVLLTTNGTFNFYPKEVSPFIASLKPVTNELPSAVTATKPSKKQELVIAAPVIGKTATHIKLETSLTDMIDKVLLSKDAIPQAAALCNIANTMINLEKQQVNLLKATKKL